MCLYPRLIKNRKYIANKKNGGNIPAVTDERVKYVPVGCGKCIECMKQKARNWQVRMYEEIKTNKNAKFITLTFSNESINKIIKQCELEHIVGYELDNSIATKAVRFFLERWRKKYKKSLKHWLITELGHNGTENIHLHGIIWSNESYDTIAKIWQYGYIWPRPDRKDVIKKTYVNERTINYIIKYITKVDKDHPNYKPVILCSPGIGSTYTLATDFKSHTYQGENTNETYRTRTGHKIALPIYYRNKIYTEEEREKLWMQKLDKGERWIMGEKVKADDIQEINGLLQYYREINKKLGYGSDEKNYEQWIYEMQLRIMNYEKRLAKLRKERQ